MGLGCSEEGTHEVSINDHKVKKRFVYFIRGEDGDTYVGHTTDPPNRKYQHHQRFGFGLSFKILEEVTGTAEQARSRESEWIRKLNPTANILR